MLSKLIKLKEMIKTHTDEAIIEYIDTLIKHEEEQERVKLNKNNRSLNGYNAAMKVLKNKHIKNRPVLQTAHQYADGKITFTDSIQAYLLNDNRYNLPLGDGVNYPDMTPIFETRFMYESVELPSVTDLKVAIKKKENLFVGKALVDPNLLLNAYAILGDNLTGYYGSKLRPIKLVNKNNEIGMVLPLKQTEE